MCINWQFTHDLYNDKNALTVAFSLTCLEIRSQNEEAINSTQNRIYSLKVFYFRLYRLYRLQYFLFFLNWFSVSDDRKYLCGLQAWLFACINTRKFKGLDSGEITSLPEIKKVILIARHFNHHWKHPRRPRGR